MARVHDHSNRFVDAVSDTYIMRVAKDRNTYLATPVGDQSCPTPKPARCIRLKTHDLCQNDGRRLKKGMSPLSLPLCPQLRLSNIALKVK